MQALITTVHVIACLLLIGVVLLQSGRGGGVGAAFAGASSQVFGGRGASSFLTRVTSGAATVFFLTSMVLSTLSSRHRSVLLRTAPAAAAPDQPGEGAPAADTAANPAPAPAADAAADPAPAPAADAAADPAPTSAADPPAAPASPPNPPPNP